MKNFILFISLLFLLPSLSLKAAQVDIEIENILNPFKTDGCSVVPDGTPRDRTKWRNCCIDHDVAYWQGGTKSQRKNADKELSQCMAKSGHPYIGKIYYLGVRVGGRARTSASYRWGYGWQYERGYRELSESELIKVNKLKPVDPYSYEVDKSPNPVSPYPSVTGNYCVDEINTMLKEMNFDISSIERVYLDDTNKRIKLKSSSCRRQVVFKYRAKQWKKCNRKRIFTDIKPVFNPRVKYLDSCKF